MVLALDAVMNLAAEIELTNRSRFIGHAVAPECFFTDFSDTDPFHPGRRAGEIAID